MDKEHRIEVISRFNQCITEKDLDTLRSLMTEGHRFIDASGDVVEGKKEMTEAWRDFFRRYPDYCNVFEPYEVREGLVIMLGYSICSHEELDGPAIWSARVRGNRVSEWRVYDDTEATRKMLETD
ncbi:nuclear transport factor 2 family protein [Candidatus Thorarchaeota archaeon]|nr:MAG: nuclear transport factor 2 family protein [Candidatus Thorarchaeota archaeon]